MIDYRDPNKMFPIILSKFENYDEFSSLISTPEASSFEYFAAFNYINSTNCNITIVKYDNYENNQGIRSIVYMIKIKNKYYIIPYSDKEFEFEIKEYSNFEIYNYSVYDQTTDEGENNEYDDITLISNKLNEIVI